MEKIEFQIIGKVSSDFKEKFCIPRQAGLAPSSKGVLKLDSKMCSEQSLYGLDTFSHMIINFIPHQATFTSFSVRPPRLGGNKKMGVFATRSPFRPNPIGSSTVKIDKVDPLNNKIYFSNHDLLDGTPVIDIKPYVPEWDSVTEACAGWTGSYPEKRIPVDETGLEEIPERLRKLIVEILSLDPRPRYHEIGREYGVELSDWNIRFKYESEELIKIVHVSALEGPR